MKIWKVGLVGAGRVSQRHVDALGKCSGAELVAVADPSAEAMAKLALPAEIRTGRDSEALLRDPSIEVVFVCTPHALHAPYALLALEHGKHVFLEKPMCNTVAECDAVIELAERNRLRVGVGHHQTFLPVFKKFKQLLDAGTIGRPMLMVDRMVFDNGWERRAPWWKQRAQAGGGMLMNMGVHQIDRVLWLAGQSPEAVRASIHCALPEMDVDTDYALALDFPATTAVILGTSYPCKSSHLFEAVGTAGRLWLDPAAEEVSYTLADGAQHTVHAPGYFCAIGEMVNEFIASLAAEKSCRVDGHWGREVIRVAAAAYASAGLA